MQRNEGVHLHAVQEDLDHDETRSFECKSGALAEEPNELKVDFTVSGCKWKGLVWVWEMMDITREGGSDLPRKQPVEINYLYIPSANRESREKKNDTHQNNDNQSPVWLLDLECKRNQEDSHRVKGLEHLDKRDAQREVSIVGQDERAREEGADGEDGSHPLFAL